MYRFIITCSLLIIGFITNAQSYQIAVLKYNGGGDWYANLQTSLPNLINYANQNLNLNISSEQATVEVGSEELMNYPFVHMTGHGNVVFSGSERDNLRMYLLGGGFLHIDDNYGMDSFVRIEMKKVFPELDWVELPISHPIFHQSFDFPQGLPKIHEHDNKSPQALGLMYEGRLICLYTFEADLGDGWESTSVHGDSESNHIQALQMGCNILEFVFLGNGIQ